MGVLPPTSSFYFIHPSLNEAIRRIRNVQGQDYELVKVTVGQGCEWGDRQNVICLLPMLIAECPDRAIKSQLLELFESSGHTEQGKAVTELSSGFVDLMWKINGVIEEQFPLAAWAALWYYVVELCSKYAK